MFGDRRPPVRSRKPGVRGRVPSSPSHEAEGRRGARGGGAGRVGPPASSTRARIRLRAAVRRQSWREAGRHAGGLTGGAPRRAPVADGDAVAVGCPGRGVPAVGPARRRWAASVAATSLVTRLRDPAYEIVPNRALHRRGRGPRTNRTSRFAVPATASPARISHRSIPSGRLPSCGSSPRSAPT